MYKFHYAHLHNHFQVPSDAVRYAGNVIRLFSLSITGALMHFALSFCQQASFSTTQVQAQHNLKVVEFIFQVPDSNTRPVQDQCCLDQAKSVKSSQPFHNTWCNGPRPDIWLPQQKEFWHFMGKHTKILIKDFLLMILVD